MSNAIHDWEHLDPIIVARAKKGDRGCDIAADLNICQKTVNNRLTNLRQRGVLPPVGSVAPKAETKRGPISQARLSAIGVFGRKALPPFHPIAAEALAWSPSAD